MVSHRHDMLYHNIWQSLMCKTPELCLLYHADISISRWSDGMGNPKDNSLPKCQLLRIQNMVDEINFPDRANVEHVPFWIDTLCVPVREEFKDFRKRCIVNMRNIYERAAAVLVLDAGLQEIPRSAPVVERCVRLHQSFWQRRLWTFQEGMLAQELYYRFSDKSQYLRDLTNEAIKYEDQLRAKGIYVSIRETAESKVNVQFTLLKQPISRIKCGWDSPSSRWITFLPLTEAIRSRRTSRASDEVLCAATILGIDPTPFLEIKEKDVQRLADRRMELFLQYIHKFPSGIIFNRLPRLQSDGYRWAPRSLMGGLSGDIGDLSDTDNYGEIYKLDQSISLWVRYPGIKLEPIKSHLNTRIIVITGNDQHSVQLSPDEKGNYIRWNKDLLYYLVMAKIPSSESGSLAILGSKDKSENVNLRHECLAWIELLAEPEDGDVRGEILSEDTYWYIM